MSRLIQFSRLLLAPLLFVSLFFSPTLASADGVQDSSVGLSSGGFHLSVAEVEFPVGLISTAGEDTQEDTITMTVLDDRGSSEGWSVSVLASDLLSEPFPDRTTNGGTLRISIPATSFYAQVLNVSLVEGENGMPINPIGGPYGLLTEGHELSNSSILLLQSRPGYGMGEYEAEIKYTFRSPKVGTISSLSHPETSFYSTGDTLGLLAGQYVSTFTYILSSGI